MSSKSQSPHYLNNSDRKLECVNQIKSNFTKLQCKHFLTKCVGSWVHGALRNWKVVPVYDSAVINAFPIRHIVSCSLLLAQRPQPDWNKYSVPVATWLLHWLLATNGHHLSPLPYLLPGKTDNETIYQQSNTFNYEPLIIGFFVQLPLTFSFYSVNALCSQMLNKANVLLGLYRT